MSPPKALIAGAGIGGLCAALCLARSGFLVRIFERAPVLEEAGAGLQLSPNASAILQKLGAVDGLASFALCPEAIRLRRARDGETLALLPLKDACQRWGAPYLVAHRADLQRVLLERLAREPAIRLETGAAIADFAANPAGVSAVIEQNGRRRNDAGDCLIGADGLRSLVARKLGAAAPVFSGRTAWRALIDAARVPAGMRRPETSLWLGHKAHLVHYPLRGGAIVNAVAIVEEDFEPRGAEFWSSLGAPEILEKRFGAWDGAARALFRAAPEWRKWPLFDRRPLSSWVTGRVALLGDAAHPMLPFLAQGAAQAIEDAEALGTMLGTRRPIEESLRDYQAARAARAARVQKESRRQAMLYHLGPPAASFRDAALRALGGGKLLRRYDWLYSACGASR